MYIKCTYFTVEFTFKIIQFMCISNCDLFHARSLSLIRNSLICLHTVVFQHMTLLEALKEARLMRLVIVSGSRFCRCGVRLILFNEGSYRKFVLSLEL